MSPTRDRVLRVDLSTGETVREPVPPEWRRDYLGGKGLGARYLYEEVPPGADPTGPTNCLGLFVGPLAGFLPGETRYAAVTKSPLTEGFLDSYAGGAFADRLAGSLDDCLGLLVTGAADRPVRIEVADGRARIEPSDAWGDDAAETADRFPDAAVACVGPAGESEAAYATIASDGGAHHAGRGGAGAVMGAKGLKAVVARDPPPAVPDDLAALRERDIAAYGRDATGEWQAAGATVETVDYANEVGILAAEGWTGTGFDDADDIGVEAALVRATGREAVGAGRDGDAESGAPAVPGGFRIDTPDGEVVPRGAGPITLGAGLGIGDFDRVVDLCGCCDRLGLDVIGAGNAVAWAIRAGEAGIVDCPVRFGDPAGAERLLEAIASREAPPDLDVDPELPDALADGIDAAVARFGGESLVPTVKSMALPGFDPRAAIGVGLAYATSDRGACHRRARPQDREPLASPDRTPIDQVRDVVGEQNARSVLWSLVVDDFVGEAVWTDLGAEWLAAVDHLAVAETDRDEPGHGADRDDATRTADPEASTGSVSTLATTGERIWTLTRLFNAREGFDRDDDALPEPLRSAAGDGTPGVDGDAFDRLLDRYYAARGWGDRGLPTPETLDRLGLASVIDSATPVDEGAIDPVSAADSDD